MNSRPPFAFAFDNAPKSRIAIFVLKGVLVWLVALVEMGRWLAATSSAPASAKPLEVRMVELVPPPVQIATPFRKSVPNPTDATPQPHPPASREHATQAVATKAITQAPQNITPSASTPVARDAAQTTNTQTSTTSDEKQPAATAAHSIVQPLPALPDDLREQAYQTVATARFAIHVDGSVEVELVKPTPSPRLNPLLLEALRQWRFFPGLQNGQPVESRQDIRVHFNVD